MPTLLIRADGGEQLGAGHVMRCLALAQAWRRTGGTARFAMASSAPALAQCVLEEGFAIDPLSVEPGSTADAAATVELARRHDAHQIAVDGYRFGSPYQRALQSAGRPFLVLDDYGHADRYFADWILCQNPCASEALYASREPRTRVLLGARYLLLRDCFLPREETLREFPPNARRILVTLGAADPDNATAAVLQALAGICRPGELNVRVVVGLENPRANALAAVAAQLPVRTELCANVRDMRALMLWADTAVTAGGSTCWELASMGVPALVLQTADNQQGVVDCLQRAEAAVILDRRATPAPAAWRDAIGRLLCDSTQRSKLSANARALVDGYGADRVVMRLLNRTIWLRHVVPGDARLLWEWANDPDTRAMSFHPAPIPFATHQEWMERKLSDPATTFLLALDAADRRVAQVRFDVTNTAAVVSISVAREYRGQGLAIPVLQSACRRFFANPAAPAVIHALIKPQNTASLRTFAKAGFTSQAQESVDGQPAVRCILRKDFPA